LKEIYTAMKKYIFALMVAASMAHSQATVLTLNGNLTWDVTEPRCTFKLNGKLANRTSQGSGTLKVLLWATKSAFPSYPGFLVAETTLGTINSGYQAGNFTLSTASKIPPVSGSYIFTVVIAEYQVDRWNNILAIPSGSRTLLDGDFPGQKKWSLPTTAVQPATAQFKAGSILRLSAKATNELNQFPTALQERTDLFISTKSKLSRKYRGATVKGSYSLKTKNAQYNGAVSTCGIVTVKYSASSKATVTLFYQSANSGTYKSVDVNGSDTATTWGTFKLL
jgi:hypothetical protein